MIRRPVLRPPAELRFPTQDGAGVGGKGNKILPDKLGWFGNLQRVVEGKNKMQIEILLGKNGTSKKLDTLWCFISINQLKFTM